MISKNTGKPAKAADRRLDRLKIAVVLSRLDRLEKRILELENKFFAFQCGAQAQMEWSSLITGRDMNRRPPAAGGYAAQSNASRKARQDAGQLAPDAEAGLRRT